MDEQTESIIFSALTLNTEIATQDYGLDQEKRGSTLLRTSVGSLQLILQKVLLVIRLFSDTSLTIDQIQSMTGLHFHIIARIQQIQKDLQRQCFKLKRSYFKAKSFNLQKKDPSLNLQAKSTETYKESNLFNNQQKTAGKETSTSLQETLCHPTVQLHQNEIRNMIINQPQTFEFQTQNQCQQLDENKTLQTNQDCNQYHSLPLMQKSFSNPNTIYINQKNCENKGTQKEKQELSDEEGFLSIKTSKSQQIQNSKTQKQMQESPDTNQKKSSIENIRTIKKIGRKRLRKENIESQELLNELQNQKDFTNSDKQTLYNEIEIEVKSCNTKDFEKENKLNLNIQNDSKEQQEKIGIKQVSNSVFEFSQNDQDFKIQKKQKVEYPQSIKNDYHKKQQEKDQENTFNQISNPQEKSDQTKQSMKKEKNQLIDKEIKNGVSKKYMQKKNECFQSQKDQGLSLINESYKGTIFSQSKQQKDKLNQITSCQKEEAQNLKATIKQGYIRLKRNRKNQENEKKSYEKSKQVSGKDKLLSKVQLENEESISCCIMKKRKKNQFGDKEQGNNDFQAEGIKQEIYKTQNSTIKNAKSLSNSQGKQALDNTDINQSVKQDQLPKRNQTKLKIERANPRQLQSFLGHIDINSLNPKTQKSIRSSQK